MVDTTGTWLHKEFLARLFFSENKAVISEGIWWTLVIVASVIANSLALASLVYSPEVKIFHKQFLVLLFLTNLVTSVSTLPFLALDCYFKIRNQALFITFKILWTASFATNKGFLVLLQYDRYLKARRRHAYTSYMTNIRVYYLSCIPVVVAVAMSGLSLIFFEAVLQLLSAGSILIMTTLIVLATRNCFTRTLNRQIADNSHGTQTNHENGNHSNNRRSRSLAYLSHSILFQTVLLLSPGLATSLMLYLPQYQSVTPLLAANRYVTRFTIFGVLLDPIVYIWTVFIKQHRSVTCNNVQVCEVQQSTQSISQESIALDPPESQDKTQNQVVGDTTITPESPWKCPALSPISDSTTTWISNDINRNSNTASSRKGEEWPEHMKVRSAHRPSVCFIRALDMVRETTAEE